MPPQVAGVRPFLEDCLDGGKDRIVGAPAGAFTLTEEIEHHRPRPDRADRVGDVLSIDVGCGAVHGLEQRGKAALRVEVGRRREPQRAGARRPEVGDDVPEKVGSDHHVEALRLQHEARAQGVDVLLVPAHLRELLRHLGRACVPPRHAHRHAIALGRHGQVLARALAGLLESEAQHTVGAVAGEHRLLHHHLALGTLEHRAAHRGVLALGVFAHDQHVDVAGGPASERGWHAIEEARRAQVDVLVELAPELEQRAPQGDVVWHRLRPAHGAEVDRIDTGKLVLPVVGHHLAGLQVVVAARPLDVLIRERDAEQLARAVKHPQAFREHFLANAVAGNDGNPE